MENKKILKDIGYNIQEARLKKGYTQEFVAEKCNVSPKYISIIETGKATCSIPVFVDICNLLDISPNYLFKGAIKNVSDTIDVLPHEISLQYLKLKEDNKSFVNDTIKHLYSMQRRR